MSVKKAFCAGITIFLIAGFVSCKKYLSKSPDSSNHVIKTIGDLQMLMDNTIVTNSSYPALADVVSDEIYVNAADFQASDSIYRKQYLWIKDDNTLNTWSKAYATILHVNIVLDELIQLNDPAATRESYENVKGSALFIRAFYFYGLAQLFAPPYNSASAAADLGIPLRLNSDLEEKSTRASVKETYERILIDMKTAASILPLKAEAITRPGKEAVYGALARVYLSMAQYDSSLVYANKYLATRNVLADYNVLTNSATPLADRYKTEVVFMVNSSNIFRRDRMKIDSLLYRSFDQNDLRKTIHFKLTGSVATYNGEFDPSTGNNNATASFPVISTDEMYLIKAECLARNNQLEDALFCINKLLESRYRKGFFTPATPSTAQNLLKLVLMERKKQLIRRGLRWTDIRRLTIESPDYSSSISRNMNGIIYKLPSKPYLFLLPKNAIAIGGIPQND